MSACPHCRASRERAEELEEELRQLRAAAAEPKPAPREWELSPQEAILAWMLIERPLVTARRFFEQREAQSPDLVDESPTLFKTLTYHLRRKLAPWGVEILTRWGVGYELAPATRERMRECWINGDPIVGPSVTGDVSRGEVVDLIVAALAACPDELSGAEVWRSVIQQRPETARGAVTGCLKRMALDGRLESEPLGRHFNGGELVLYRLPTRDQAEAA